MLDDLVLDERGVDDLVGLDDRVLDEFLDSLGALLFAAVDFSALGWLLFSAFAVLLLGLKLVPSEP